ncbi:MAG: hypothetical protein ABSH13_04710 [Candidatus Acidiferrum sp.]|jgi:hypothetical protein
MKSICRTSLCAGLGLVLAGFAAVSPATAQEAGAAASGRTEVTLAGGTPILVELNNGVDSKKAKVGDPIVAHTTAALKSTDDRTILPKGAKVEGHITQADAKSKGGTESALGIQFDKAIMKDGGEIPLSVVIQAVGAPANFSGAGDTSSLPSPSNTGTTQTSPMSTQHMPPPTAQEAGGAPPDAGAGAASSPRLDAKSRGAIGLRGITLNDEPANSRPATVVVSNGKSVRLDGGTQLLLVVQAQTPAQ